MALDWTAHSAYTERSKENIEIMALKLLNFCSALLT